MKTGTCVLWAGMGLASLFSAPAPGETAPLKKLDLKRDTETLRRGAETVTGVCMGCHSLKYIRYRDLAQLGFTTGQFDALRGEHSMEDPLLSTTPPEAAKAAYGVDPPDLSLMAQARAGGPRYIYTMLTGFYQRPDGSTDNHLYPGIRMPDILGYSATTDTAQRASLEKTAGNVAAFLAWASDPNAGKRQRLGMYVLGYLVVLTVLLYLLKRRTWRRLETLPLPAERRHAERRERA